jgi:hypothetical protein
MSRQQSETVSFTFTFGGRVRCRRCSARSKRTGIQYRVAALKGKTKCAAHGGKSTGPRTGEGKARIDAAKTIHGQDTRAARAERRLALASLAEIEELCRRTGMIRGPRSMGPRIKPRPQPEKLRAATPHRRQARPLKGCYRKWRSDTPRRRVRQLAQSNRSVACLGLCPVPPRKALRANFMVIGTNSLSPP